MGAPIERLYTMIKPPPEAKADIEKSRATLGLPAKYDADRWHITVWPFGDIGNLPPSRRDPLIALLAAIDLDCRPFRLALDRFDGKALLVGQGSRKIVELRRIIEATLKAYGDKRRFENRPHMSLVYGQQYPSSRIEPVEWIVNEIRLVGSLEGQGRHIDYGAIPLRPRQGSLL